MIRFLPLLCIIAAPAGASADAETKALLEQAIDTYETAFDASDRDRRLQLFGRAESLFESVIANISEEGNGNSVSADLYVNLGNAALGAEHLGPAILAYRRALMNDPKHRRAKQNLQHARTLLPSWVPTPEEDTSSIGSFFDWTKGLKREDWFGLAAILFLITTILVAIYLRTSKSIARNLAIASALAWAGCLAWPLTLRNDSTQAAVVIVPDVAARTADSVNASAKFPEPLPSGVEVEVMEDRADWIRVKFPDSREAWLPSQAVEYLVSPLLDGETTKSKPSGRRTARV